MDVLAKEMVNTKVAFEFLKNGEVVPRDCQYLVCHIVCDVNMEDFRRKKILLAGDQLTTAPTVITYVTVVSKETVNITLTLTTLNNLEVKCGDVENYYIIVPGRDNLDHFRLRT